LATQQHPGPAFLPIRSIAASHCCPDLISDRLGILSQDAGIAAGRTWLDLLGDYVFRLWAFLALGHFHRDLLSFLQGLESFHLNRCVVHKHILTTLASV